MALDREFFSIKKGLRDQKTLNSFRGIGKNISDSLHKFKRYTGLKTILKKKEFIFPVVQSFHHPQAVLVETPHSNFLLLFFYRNLPIPFSDFAYIQIWRGRGSLIVLKNVIQWKWRIHPNHYQGKDFITCSLYKKHLQLI